MERAYQEQSMMLQYLKCIASSIPCAMPLALRIWSGASGLRNFWWLKRPAGCDIEMCWKRQPDLPLRAQRDSRIACGDSSGGNSPQAVDSVDQKHRTRGHRTAAPIELHSVRGLAAIATSPSDSGIVDLHECCHKRSRPSACGCFRNDSRKPS